MIIQDRRTIIPGLDSRLGSPNSVAHALFQLSATNDFPSFRPLLSLIERTLNREARFVTKLHYLPNLVKKDPRQIAQALCEIANCSEAVHFLHQNTETRRALGESLEGTKIDVSRVKQAATDWENSFDPAHSNDYSLFTGRDVQAYGASLTRLSKKGFLTLPNPTNTWTRGADDIIERALAGSLSVHDMAEFAETVRGAASPRPLTFFNDDPNADIVDCLRSMARDTSYPTHTDTAASLMLSLDFVNVGSVLTAYLKSHAADVGYESVLRAMTLTLMGFSRFIPLVLNPDGVRGLNSEVQGRDQLLTINHWSQLDILLQEALAPRARIVSKEELSFAPILGWTPIHGLDMTAHSVFKEVEHILIDRKGGSKAHDKMTRDMIDRLERDFLVSWYPEGHRSDVKKKRNAEVGIQPYKCGVFIPPAIRNQPTMITPTLFWGVGAMLPASLVESFSDGLMLGQRVAIDVVDPILFEPTAGDPKDKAKEMALETFYQSWMRLAPMQAFMNSRTF